MAEEVNTGAEEPLLPKPQFLIGFERPPTLNWVRIHFPPVKHLGDDGKEIVTKRPTILVRRSMIVFFEGIRKVSKDGVLKVQMIKYLRTEVNGLGLKDAKDIVDEILARVDHGAQYASGWGSG